MFFIHMGYVVPGIVYGRGGGDPFTLNPYRTAHTSPWEKPLGTCVGYFFAVVKGLNVTVSRGLGYEERDYRQTGLLVKSGRFCGATMESLEVS